jgi:hypothetical protein
MPWQSTSSVIYARPRMPARASIACRSFLMPYGSDRIIPRNRMQKAIRPNLKSACPTAGRAFARAGGRPLNDKDSPATWRDDIDALVFKPDGHQGFCVVHRRAFRTLQRFTPAPADCQTYFCTHEDAFRAAASAKILLKNVGSGMNFHLTSRDVARQIKN